MLPLSTLARHHARSSLISSRNLSPESMEPHMQQVASDLIKVEGAIEVCEHDIRTIERKIKHEEELSKRELSSTDLAYWRTEKEQLRKREEQLRKKDSSTTPSPCDDRPRSLPLS